MASLNPIATQFAPLFTELERDRTLSDSIREKSKDLDRTYRSLSSLLNSVHSTKGSEFDSIIISSLPLISQARLQIQELKELVPEGGYYRWCDDFSFSLRNITSSIILIFLLRSGNLLSKQDASLILDLKQDRIMLSTEDYLHATINTLNELPRLAVNSVTLGDFRTPLRLAKVVKEVHAGFQLLNLKNDSLRKRFDGIKYDVKKIEEVVYDISLRRLIPQGEDNGSEGLAYQIGDGEKAGLVRKLAEIERGTDEMEA